MALMFEDVAIEVVGLLAEGDGVMSDRAWMTWPADQLTARHLKGIAMQCR